MKRALVLGGAACVWGDAVAALKLFKPDVVIAANDIGTRWAGRLDVWCSLHPDKFFPWKRQRSARGLKPALEYFAHDAKGTDTHRATEFRFKGQHSSGSSGLFGAKIALVDLGCDRVVVAGCPIVAEQAHFFSTKMWPDSKNFQKGWEEALPEIKDRLRSMSGWTAELLGTPTPEWLAN